MNIGDPIDTPHGKGKLIGIHGDGKVGVVKVRGKSVYVRLPDSPAPETESPDTQPAIEPTTEAIH